MFLLPICFYFTKSFLLTPEKTVPNIDLFCLIVQSMCPFFLEFKWNVFSDTIVSQNDATANITIFSRFVCISVLSPACSALV